MFEGLSRPARRRFTPGMAVSCALHVAFLLALIHHAAASFVTPSEVDLGIPHSSGSVSITYLAPVGPERMQSPQEKPQVALRAAVRKKPAPPKPEPKPEQDAALTAAEAPEQTARGGSPFGRVPGSPMTGDEVMPAFPVVFPDPPVSRADLPSGVTGDVIVEVTIDAQGNVVETKLLQGIGYGIEQKVLEVLQRWRFHPATRDGMNIASQHIVHFHYPS
jgi:periplasmic protein TonB